MMPIYDYDYKICAFDPGTSNLGFAIMTIDIDTYAIRSIWASTIYSDQCLTDPIRPTYQDLNDRPSSLLRRYDRIRAMMRYVRYLLRCNQPTVACCEAPFYNRRRPGAYGALVEVCYALRDTVISQDISTAFIYYEPLVVKRILGLKNYIGKDRVKQAMLKKTDILNALTVDIHRLDEHAIDAIAVAYAHLQTLRAES